MHWIFWLVLFIVFIAVELSTVQLVSIWFAIGAIGAGIASMISNDNILVELITFIAVTAIALVATRPFVKKVTHNTPVPTNADSLIGLTAIVCEKIDNVKACGAVTVKGATWTARSETDDIIPDGSEVEIVKIDGVKLIVKAK